MRLLIIDELWKKSRGSSAENLSHPDTFQLHMAMDYIIEDCGCGRYKALKDRSGLLPKSKYFSLDTLCIVLQTNRRNHI